jgi:lipopolysaccharide export system permease protein
VRRVVPSLLDRLLLRETLVPLGVGLLAILQLLVLAQLLQLNEVVFGAAVTPGDLVRVTLGLAPHFLVMAVPLAFMLGLQLALGRLAADREVLALSAAGRSPLALYRVPLLLACALGLATAALARWAEPWGLSELNRALNGVIKRNLGSGLKPGIFNTGLPRYMVYVSSIDEPASGAGTSQEFGQALWRGVLIEDAVGDGQSPMLALAETGRISDAGGELLSLELLQGELHRREPAGETLARFREARFLVGVEERVSRTNKFAGSEAQLPAAELEARAARMEAQGRRQEAGRLRLERFRRIAVPLACLAFALLGVPLALVAGRVRGAAYLVTLGAFVGFYSLSRLGVALADAHFPPALAAFVPDGAVAALGAWFTARLVRRGVGQPR